MLRALAARPELARHGAGGFARGPRGGLPRAADPAGRRGLEPSIRRPAASRTPPRAPSGGRSRPLHELPADGIDDLPTGPDRLWGLTLPEPPHELLLDLSAAALELLRRLQDQRALVRPAAGAARRHLRRRDRARRSAMGQLHGGRGTGCPAAHPRAARGLGALRARPRGFRRRHGRWPSTSARGWGRSRCRIRATRAGSSTTRGIRSASMRPAIGAFWTAYRSARARPPALAQVVELAAVRLLQAALERARHSDELSAHAVVLAQVAAHLLRDPEGAALALLGLHE